MARTIAIVGGGIAGVAAAFAAQRKGFDVTLLGSSTGATSLYSGALDPPEPGASVDDGTRDEQRALTQADERLRQDLDAFVASMALWGKRKHVITGEGRVRGSRLGDHALLDVSRASGQVVAVLGEARCGWNRHAIAETLQTQSWSRETGTEFRAFDVELCRDPAELRLTELEFAALHDDPRRLSWLARQLSVSLRGCGAALVGPWLGLSPQSVTTLRGSFSAMQIGEVLSGVGGAAGHRWEVARATFLVSLGIELHDVSVECITREGEKWSVRGTMCGDDGAALWQSETTDAVVLATGGLVGGGLQATGGGSGISGFSLCPSAPLPLELDGVQLDPGPRDWEFDRLGVSVLDRIGCSSQSRRAPGLFAAGELVAGLSRTALASAASGLLAAHRAAQDFGLGS